MNFKTIFSTGMFAFAAVAALNAAEPLSLKSAADFMTSRSISSQNGAIVGKGQFTVYSKKAFQVNPAAKYRISGEIKTVSGTPGLFFLGYVPQDTKGEVISSFQVNPTAGSMTELVSAAKKGDKVLILKDASKWNMKSNYSFAAFNAKADFSDLPNRDLAHTIQGKIVKKGNVWEAALKAPLKKDYPAGTKVRQQCAGNGYIYTHIINKLPAGESQKMPPRICGGLRDKGLDGGKFWPGTKSAKVLLMYIGGKNTVVELKDLKLEEIK